MRFMLSKKGLERPGGRLTSTYRAAWVVILVCVLPTLACNFPFPTSTPNPAIELQRTLTALAPQQPEEPTPVPQSPSIEGVPAGSNHTTATPAASNEQQLIIPQLEVKGDWFAYRSAAGDTLHAAAKRFAVEPDQIITSEQIQGPGLLPPGTVLQIPNQLGELNPNGILLPDSEVINSPAAVDFQIEEFINEAGGYLGEHHEQVNGSLLSGAEILTKVSQENSINPRLLLALLESRSGWVYGDLGSAEQLDYPIGFYVPDYKGLYYELVLTATHLGAGYYGWRSGDRTSMSFQDGSWVRMYPGLNAGSAAVQNVLSKISTQDEWRAVLYGEPGLVDLYSAMFGDPWSRAAQFEPLYSIDLSQPELLLPFAPGERWSFTGGPHRSWNAGSPRGALDFSPVTGEPACTTSRAWVTASASGVITRVSDSVLALDLDGDGYEQTGWVLVYLHIVVPEGIREGDFVAVDQPLGHPSCERGKSTGTHVHLARRYNGEWLEAGDPIAFILSGWETVVGERNYQGELRKAGQTVVANPGGPGSSLITRQD